MLYRETGQFKTSYAADQQIFPIRQDRVGIALLLIFAYLVVPFIADQYWFSAILIPFLIFSLATLGLNILTGYAGQLSLGSAAFMAVGAFGAYNFILRMDMPAIPAFLLGGLCAALVGVLFGLPSLRIKGFYLAVATLAAQFFVVWALTKFGWFSNYSSSGVITAQTIELFGMFPIDTPMEKYLLTLFVVTILALAAKNMVRSNTGRSWMAVRDMDVAAEVIGIPLMKTKLLAFAVSSFYCGVAGALVAYCYLGTVEPEYFTLDLSFRILFMVIVGGVGSILGSFFGAAFITLLPIVLNIVLHPLFGLFGIDISTAVVSNMELMIFGGMIIFFLAVEPHGLARLWQIGKEKLRIWPFPH